MTDLLKHLKKYLAKTKNDWNYITPTDFYKKYYNNKTKADKYVLIDVRQESEFKKYHIKGAKNIFWLDLLKDENLKKLPKNNFKYDVFRWILFFKFCIIFSKK
jgi:3-mercaptopyruvate sulfurtransferase SseA